MKDNIRSYVISESNIFNITCPQVEKNKLFEKNLYDLQTRRIHESLHFVVRASNASQFIKKEVLMPNTIPLKSRCTPSAPCRS